MSAEHRLTPRQKIEQGIQAWDRDEYRAALDIFEEVITERPDFPDVHNRAGLCKAMLGDLEGGLVSFERALELAPTYAEAHFNKGIVLNELGRHQEAERAFRQAQDLDTRDGTRFPSQVGNQIANALGQLGDLYMVADSPREAVEQYREALRVRRRFLDIREKLAEALLAIGENEEARKELERVLDEEPGFAQARLKLGVVLQRLGDRDGAVREWKRVWSQRPDDRRVHAYLASEGVDADALTA
jgi:tetratricopeptide (TPR) repeat protein